MFTDDFYLPEGEEDHWEQPCGRTTKAHMKINPARKVNEPANRLYTRSSDKADAQPEPAASPRRSSPVYVLIPVSHVPLAEALNICDPSPDPETELIQTRKDALVASLLDSLEPGDRALARSRFVDGDTYSSIAARQGVSKEAVHKRMARILRAMKTALAEQGITRLEDVL
jgi:RNA polymerase sigma factor (sigma-70 family)